VLPRFHTRPINVVVYDGSIGRTSFEVSFSFVFSYPALHNTKIKKTINPSKKKESWSADLE
jgi:hypothetical protein